MDGNRDESQRCIEIAVAAIREGKLERAEKFLKKAESLYPSQKAKGECIYHISKANSAMSFGLASSTQLKLE